ncbi:zinc-type alcohol dehydrogenase-like protein YogA [Apiospora kogelbergensis]|uniref:zinc-type alcohol dehydrogenase-like protein YogA n=1 Tax=Apiospora kogelbergensis TaxID=1337665 RepID=UPI0031306702
MSTTSSNAPTKGGTTSDSKSQNNNTYLTVRKIDGKPGRVYYPLQLHTAPIPEPGPGEVLVELHAAALNHRDLFIRQHLYPGISFTHPLLADGCGTVIRTAGDEQSDHGASANLLLNRKVILTPTRGWHRSRDGPEDLKKYTVIGGSSGSPAGAAQRYIAVPASEVELAPAHLSAAEGAALPLVGVTAWRALVTKCFDGDLTGAAGRNILVTGIGGGVALQVLQFGVALGCRVYVTSGDVAKLRRATSELGAAGGVSYRDKDWDAQLGRMLPKDRPFLDAVVDGAGGDLVARTVRLLKPGGILSCYGMTVSPNMNWSMGAVMKNIELRGSTMGSHAEFAAMVEFVRRHKIRPVLSRIVKGGLEDLDAINGLYEDMRQGKQFGKLVIEISPENGGEAATAKL